MRHAVIQRTLKHHMFRDDMLAGVQGHAYKVLLTFAAYAPEEYKQIIEIRRIDVFTSHI
jgi:hypothetical protein